MTSEKILNDYPKEWKDAELFERTISKFIIQEEYILVNNLSERCITHKLAEHLKNSFSYYDIDCEYNRMELGVSSQDYVAKTLCLKSEKVSTDSIDGDTVFPDIIIHKRGNNEDNYLVVEVKKKSYADKRNGDGKEYRDFDRKKLCAYTKELKYEWGIYLEFEEGNISLVEFYQNGKKWVNSLNEHV
ncbi:MAG: hypothetical protein WCX73_05100 [Candidatus Pacearchaeota archaeon]|jgi:hypothetical protein